MEISTSSAWWPLNSVNRANSDNADNSKNSDNTNGSKNSDNSDNRDSSNNRDNNDKSGNSEIVSKGTTGTKWQHSQKRQ